MSETVIDAARLQRQREFSEVTFGPGARTKGVADHIRKELKEIEADPTDVSEWIDVVILGLDGAWRAGGEPQQIIDGIISKLERNEQRAWPDWRTRSQDSAIEHVPETWIDAIRKVLREAPPEGVSAADIRREMTKRWPESFPYVTTLDIADELPIIATRRGSWRDA